MAEIKFTSPLPLLSCFCRRYPTFAARMRHFLVFLLSNLEQENPITKYDTVTTAWQALVAVAFKYFGDYSERRNFQFGNIDVKVFRLI